MKLKTGDRVVYRENGQLFEGVVLHIDGDEIEIDDASIKKYENVVSV